MCQFQSTLGVKAMKAIKILAVVSVVLMIASALCFGTVMTLVSIPETFSMNIFQVDKIGVKLMLAVTFMFPPGFITGLLIAANQKP